MRDISFRPAGFNYNAPGPEAQDRLDQHAADSQPTAAAAPPARAPGVHRGPMAMPSMQAALLRQFEAGPSTRPRQEGVQHSSGDALSVAQLNQLNQLNQALLAEFRRKADANPDNTPLTKDYYCDVLAELVDWLKQQTHYPAIRSLLDLVGFACGDNHLFIHLVIQKLEKIFTARGAVPVHMGKPNPHGLALDNDLGHIIEALNLSRHKPRITLPPAFASRQDEQLLHTFRLALLGQGTYRRTANNNVAGFKHFCIWLHQQTALGKPIPHGLDSLEKLRDHPNENEVKEVITCFSMDPETTLAIGKQARTAINKFRKLMGQPLAPTTPGLRVQPTLQQLPAQPANLAPHNPDLSEPRFTASEEALLNQIFHGEADEQDDASSAIPHAQAPEASTSGAQPHGVRRPAPEVENESRAVRPRLDDSPLPTTLDELKRFLGI